MASPALILDVRVGAGVAGDRDRAIRRLEAIAERLRPCAVLQRERRWRSNADSTPTSTDQIEWEQV